MTMPSLVFHRIRLDSRVESARCQSQATGHLGRSQMAFNVVKTHSERLKRREIMMTLSTRQAPHEHLTRPALVYVRPVDTHSGPRQHGQCSPPVQLAQRAQALGWPAHLVVVIDQDQAAPEPPEPVAMALSISSPKSPGAGRSRAVFRSVALGPLQQRLVSPH